MKVLVNYTGRIGGISLYALEMTKGLLANNVDVYAIISSDNVYKHEWENLGLRKLIVIDTYNNKMTFAINTLFFYIYRKRYIYKLMINEKIDAIYLPGYSHWAGMISDLFKDIPEWITLHDPIAHSGESFFNKLMEHRWRKRIKKAKKVIILSEVFKDYVINELKIINDKIVVVPHGPFESYKVIENKKLVRYSSKKINFLFFGRIERYKGVGILLSAYTEIEKEYGDFVSLTIAGRGNINEYSSMITGLKNVNIINRWIDDEEVSGLFVGDNIVTILPYLDATQSGVVNIAMQNESLIIASATGGLSEQIGNGKYGILVEPNNRQDLYKAMLSVVKNISLYEGMVKKAKESISGMKWSALARMIIG